MSETPQDPKSLGPKVALIGAFVAIVASLVAVFVATSANR